MHPPWLCIIYAGKNALAVGGDRAFLYMEVDLICQPGGVHKPAVFRQSGSGLIQRGMGAPLQRVQELLAGHFHNAHGIAEGVNVHQRFPGYGARRDVGADAAAVGKGDVRPRGGAIGIRHKIPQIGFLAANDANACFGVFCGQIHLGGSYLLIGERLHFLILFNDILGFVIGGLGRGGGVYIHLLRRKQLAGDRAVVGNDHLPEILQLCAGGG